MQMTVDRDVLLKVLALASGIAPAKDSLPILSHLVIGEADDGGGYVQATDLDIAVRAPFEAEILGAGDICVSAKTFHDVVKRLPAKSQISLAVVDGLLKLVCGNSRFHLSTLSPDEYPSLDVKNAKATTFEIEADRLKALLAGVRHALSTDETRHYLGGVYLHAVDDQSIRGRLTAVATNGHMLALQSCEAPALSLAMPGVILPKKTVAEMLKMLSGSELVDLAVSEQLVELSLPSGWRLTSKLIAGTYPDYLRVIPQDNPHRATFPADQLAAALDRVATVLDAKSNQVVIFLKPDGPITLTARHDSNEGRDAVAAKVDGAKAAIGVNHRYLSAIMSSLAGAEIDIVYNAASDALRIEQSGNDYGLQVLMPLRHTESEHVSDEENRQQAA